MNMKKAVTFLLLIFMAIIIYQCDEDNPEEEPIQPVVELELTGPLAWIDSANTVAKIYIIRGNGGYKVVYPRKIHFGYTSESSDYVDHSENLVKATIDDRCITIELKKQMTMRGVIEGYLMITDSKDKKRLIVFQTERLGLLDFRSLEKYYLDDDDYWQL